MDNTELYKELAIKVNELVDKSIEEYTKRRTHARGALTPIPIQDGLPLILGINWGGSEGKELSGSPEDFDKDFKEYDFIKHFINFKLTDISNPNFENKCINDIIKLNFDSPNFNYSNICLLRSCDMSELQEWEIELSKEIVIELIDNVKPKWIIVLSLTQELRVKTWLENKYPFSKILFVPHPQAHLTNSNRSKIWEKELKKIIEELNLEKVE